MESSNYRNSGRAVMSNRVSGVYSYYGNRQDLSLTATGLNTPSHGLFPPPSSRGGSLRLSQSDSKAVQIMMMNKRDKTLLHRRQSEDPQSASSNTAPLVIPSAAMRPPSSRLITALNRPSPLSPSTGNGPPLGIGTTTAVGIRGPPLLLPPIQLNDQLYTIEQESTTTGDDINEREEEKEREEGEEEDGSREDTGDSLIDDSEDEEEDAHLISGVGFHDITTEGSQTALAELDFPSIANTTQHSHSNNRYPATLLMESQLTVHQSRAQGIQPSGHNPRVNNIVRAFEIKGPLDKELLQSALDKVVSLHPVLLARFIVQSDSKCFWESLQGGSIKIDQSISYEKPSELVTLARRKLFDIQLEQKLNNTSTSSTDTRGGGCHDDIDDRLSIVSYREEETSPKIKRKLIQLAPLQQPLSPINKSSCLMSAKLITKTSHEHLLLLSFSTIVVDFWSSCLFVQQLVDAYAKLEKSSSYKPSLAVIRQNKTRQDVFNSIERKRIKAGLSHPTPSLPLSRPSPPSFSPASLSRNNRHTPLFPPPLSFTNTPRATSTRERSEEITFQVRSHPCAIFEQVCLRERQILVVKPIEKLWSFWESTATCTIKRIRGPPRVKVISPLRIPSGFGEVSRPTGRPMTSRLRPLTASRQRPPTAKRSSERLIGESLTGPTMGTHYIKVEEKIGYDVIRYFPEEHLSKIDRKELLGLVTLSAYVILLGRCCRGWGGANNTTTPIVQNKEELPSLVRPHLDPLHKYDKSGETRGRLDVTINDPIGGGGKKRGNRLDVGSFLIGVDVSLRQLGPEITQGLLGPLTNTVGLRIDLSSYSSFADMVYSLSSLLPLCRAHGHFPFSTIGDELGLVHGLPVRFSHFNSYDVQQLSNPESFYFMETAVGVAEQKALARMGSCCYLNPLNSKMDDTCQLELFIWEGVKGESIEGLLYYQTKLLRHEIINTFSRELIKIMSIVSTNPLIGVHELAGAIEPPFINTGMRERKR